MRRRLITSVSNPQHAIKKQLKNTKEILCRHKNQHGLTKRPNQFVKLPVTDMPLSCKSFSVSCISYYNLVLQHHGQLQICCMTVIVSFCERDKKTVCAHICTYMSEYYELYDQNHGQLPHSLYYCRSAAVTKQDRLNSSY